MSKSIWHRYDETPKHQDIIMTDTGCWAYRADLLALETENKDLSDKIGKLEIELDHTRKALEIAVDALKKLEKELYFNNAKQTGHIADSVMSIPSIALEQITALEQKDN